MEDKELAILAAKAASDKKARDIRVLTMTGLTIVTDYFVIASATSTTQAQAVADNIEDELAKAGYFPSHREGYSEAQWILLDFGPVVAHIFVDEAREFYNLEGLWADAPAESFAD